MANQGFNSNRRQLVAAGLSAPLVMAAGQTRAAAGECTYTASGIMTTRRITIRGAGRFRSS